MKEINVMYEELKMLSKSNPLYSVKRDIFLKYCGSLEASLTDSEQEKYIEISEEENISSTGLILLTIECMQQNFIPAEFNLEEFLETRSKIYQFVTNTFNRSEDFSKEFSDLLNTLERCEEGEDFWDFYGKMNNVIEINLSNSYIRSFGLDILKYVKKAAEMEGKLVDTSFEDKMKLFSELEHGVGKVNAIRFHLFKTWLVNKDDVTNMFYKILQGNTSLKNKMHFIAASAIHNSLLCSYSNADMLDCIVKESDTWYLNRYHRKIINFVKELNNYINDFNIYTFFMKMVLNNTTLYDRNGNPLSLENAYRLLDKYDVEYFSKDEFIERGAENGA